MSDDRILLGGISFEFVRQTTVERELHWTALLLRGGISKLHSFKGETVEAFGKRAHEKLVQSGVLMELLAMEIVPLGEVWSPAIASDVLQHLRNLKHPVETTTIMRIWEYLLQELFDGGALLFLDGGDLE